MMISGRMKGGLAWAGLFLVFAVPSAEIVSSKLSPSTSFTTGTDAVETGSIGGDSKDPVRKFDSSGKPLPSYISDDADIKPVIPATRRVIPATGTSTEQANLPAEQPGVKPATKPKPQPTLQATPTAKPKPQPMQQANTAPEPEAEPVQQANTRPTTTSPSWQPSPAPATETAAIAPEPEPPTPAPVTLRPTAPIVAAPADEPLILDETVVADLPDPDRDRLTPPASIPDQQQASAPRPVTEEDLAGWESGSLADYLAANGLLNDPDVIDRADPRFDDDGFLVGDEPNRRRQVRERDFSDSEALEWTFF